MIPTLRIVLGWLCMGVAVIAMWRQTSGWVMAIPFAAALLLHGGVWRIRPVVRKTEVQKSHELVFTVFATFAFLIGAFTERAWLCWLVLGIVLAFGIVRDLWLLIHEREIDTVPPNHGF